MTSVIQIFISFIPFYGVMHSLKQKKSSFLALAFMGFTSKSSKYIGFALAEVGNVIAIGSLVALCVAPLAYIFLG